MGDSVLIERNGAILHLQLNRPDRVNAINAAMGAALVAALHDAAQDDTVRAVLLTGAGRAFCAGQDLGDAGAGLDVGETLDRIYNPTVRLIRGMPKPVVCAVQGVAAGAGANLALACDIVLAGQSARFLQAFVNIGLVPDAGGTWLLPHLVGDARARGMAMLGEPVLAPQAEAWGLIWRAVPDEALMDEATRTAARLAGLPTQAIRLMKQAFAKAPHQSLDQQLDLERELQQEAGSTPDFREGVQAFLDKRQPRFTGRTA